MNFAETVDRILYIGEEMRKNVMENHNELLGNLMYTNDEIINFKKEMLKLFKTFKDTRYVLPPEKTTRLTSSYEIKVEKNKTQNSSKIDDAVTKYIDRQTFALDICDTLENLSKKLTSEEFDYLYNTFLTHKSEEEIAEIIKISKTYLQRIKRSCIVKMWIELEVYCRKEN